VSYFVEAVRRQADTDKGAQSFLINDTKFYF
jgi:hypothetical protein